MESLQKNRQILYSWNWFYSNSKSNLMNSRYDDKSYVGNGFGLAIYTSLRFREDKIKSLKLNKEIEQNQLELDKYYNYKKSKNDEKF
jgi:hypothetical protein